jgi:RimK family alpha-L-glutamate ligase
MEVTILSGEQGGWHLADLERALRARGHGVRIVPVDGLVCTIGGAARLRSGAAVLERCDAVLVRIIPRGSLEQIIFRMDALHRLERLGVPVLNAPTALERTVDKFYTSALLEDAGLPTPRTVVAERMDDAMAAFHEMGDVIVKPLFGSNGRGMVRVSDEEIAYRVFRALELERAVFYLQQTVPHPGRDLRCFVVGGEVVAAAWRCADGWRTNRARGGRMVAADGLPDEWREMSLAAARLVGADYAGVDLLPSSDGATYVLEVNGIPGWRGLQETTPVGIADRMVAHLEARVGARD